MNAGKRIKYPGDRLAPGDLQKELARFLQRFGFTSGSRVWAQELIGLLNNETFLTQSRVHHGIKVEVRQGRWARVGRGEYLIKEMSDGLGL